MRRKSNPEKRFQTLGEVRFDESLDGAGCPICRHVRTSEEAWIWQVLYEFGSDRSLRRQLDESLGLCPDHAHLLVRVVEERELIDGASVAHIYQTVVRRALRGYRSAVDGSRRALRSLDTLRDGECPLCVHRRGVEERAVGLLLSSLRSAAGVARYRSSDGLCDAHLHRCTIEAKEGEVRRMLLEDHIERVDRLADALDAFVRKQRYDVDEVITDAEAASWREAIWRLAGMQFDEPLVHRRLR